MRIPGVRDPPTLEALACCEALALASDLALSHVIIASDCQVVVLDIKKQIGGIYASIAKEIVDTARTFNDCTFIFEGRASNLETHSLAKHAFGLDFGRHVWYSFFEENADMRRIVNGKC
ncbi:Aspartic proteinase nepenthesin-2 [Hordeum vulgare]|nr:Aspartic proteinase nepenthesin-2 [Hordeum vulgare]